MRKLLSGVILACLCMMLVVPVGALEEPIVEFDGTTSLKYNMDEDAFGTHFEGMMPSEERIQSITLKNTSDKEVHFFMSTEVIKVFEDAKESAKDGGYTVSLTLVQDGKETLIYGNRGEINVGGTDGNGLYDMNGTLNDKFMIATLSPNKEAVVNLSVKLDGQTIDNEYQGLPGTFQFDFTVQYDNDELQTVVNTITNTIKGETQTIIEKVKTGDPTTIGGLVIILGLSAGLIVALKKGGRKNEK